MTDHDTTTDRPRVLGLISPPDVEEEQPGSGGGGGGGGSTDKVWTITGRLCVRETEILSDGNHRDRPLKGIEVKVLAPGETWRFAA